MSGRLYLVFDARYKHKFAIVDSRGYMLVPYAAGVAVGEIYDWASEDNQKRIHQPWWTFTLVKSYKQILKELL